jgi:hypothetical protein
MNDERSADRELLDRCLASMARVWSHLDDARREWKHFAEMGDILYYATEGKQGACAGYEESCRRELRP